MDIRYYSVVFTNTDKHVLMKDQNGVASPVSSDKDFIEHYEEQQKEIERLKGDKWISVDDRLPDEKQNVLVFEKDSVGSYYSVGYQDDNDWHLEYNDEQLDCVTHWQPLPKAPKGLE